MTLRLISRKAWGAKYAAGFGPAPLPAPEGLVVHHSDTASGTTPASDDASVRTLERIGQERFGGGISYTFALTPSGRLYEGTGVGRLGSHTKGHNTKARAVVFVGNYQVRKPTAQQVEVCGVLLGEGQRQGWWPHAELAGGHRDMERPGYTQCPGDALEAALPQINTAAARYLLAGKPPRRTPTQAAKTTARRPKVDLPHVVLRQGATGAAVRAVQKAVGAKVDGDYGPATARAVAAMQARLGIVHDGVYGPATEQALERWLNRGR